MATIENLIALHDGVSPAMNRIINCTEDMARRFQSATTVGSIMANAITTAAEAGQIPMAAMVEVSDIVAESIENVNEAANRVNAGASIGAMLSQIGAANTEIIDMSMHLGQIERAADQAMASTRALGSTYNQINAPPTVSAGGVSTAGAQAVERVRNEIGSMSAVAMQAAQRIIELGVACDTVNVPPQIANMIANIGDSAAEASRAIEQLTSNTIGIEVPENAANALENIGNAAEEATERVTQLGNSASESVRQVNDVGDALQQLPSSPSPFVPISSQIQNMNNNLNQTTGILGSLGEAFSSTFAQFTMATLAAGAIGKIVEILAEAPGKLMKLSDAYSGIMSRLNIVTGSQEKAIQLNDQIYYSALRARGSYADMADAVSKVALNAKEAFPDPNQVVPFVEGIQKLFAIGGTDPARQKDAMLQLTQALGSGKLQGDEFRSIAEAAPMIEQMVAKYMNVSQGALKKLSSDGAITADVMRNAILGALGEINIAFDKIPLKWSDIGQRIETESYNAFVPVFDQISRLANSEGVKRFTDNIIIGSQLAAIAVLGLMNNIEWLTNTVGSLYTQYQPAFDGIGTALMYLVGVWAIYKGGVIAATIATATWAAVTGASNVSVMIMMVTDLIRMFRTLGIVQTYAALSGTAMWFSILWPAAAVIAAVYLVSKAIEAITGSTAAAANFLEWMGSIAISFFTVYALGWITAQIPLLAHIALQAVTATWTLIVTAYTWLQNAAIIAQNSTLLIAYIRMGLVTAGMALWALATQGLTAALRILNLTMLMNPIYLVIFLVGAIIIAFGAWAAKTRGLRNTIADVFECIVDICETAVNIMIESINGLLNVINKASEGFNSLFGTKIGQVELLGKVSAQGFKNKWGSAMRNATLDDIKKAMLNLLPKGDPEEGPPPFLPPTIPTYDELTQSGKETADNTKGIKDAMDITDEDIKYLRDIAEKEAINKYTTAEIKIEVGDINNNVSSNVDLDGIFDDLSVKLNDAMSAGAEAVHQ